MSDIFSQPTTDFRPSNKAFTTYYFQVSPGYFAATQTSMLEGRDLSFTDTAKTPAVALVNQEFARRLFHTDHAVGRYYKDSTGHPVQIVGVVGNGKYMSLSEDQQAAAFYPIAQLGDTSTVLIVRSEDNAADMESTIRKTIHDLDPTVPVRQSSDWNSQLALVLFPARVATVALSLFGAFGLLLSIAGTFGLASYTVSKRLRELGIRVALGAQAQQILSAALGRMLVLLASGSLVGIVLGVAASHLLSAIVYQASAQDPFVLAAVTFTMVLTASLSVAGPVRRALRIDPAHLLREQ
jgi:ABC-type antimicrobial peptide transport system permease subunit